MNSKDRINICYFPFFDNIDDLNDQVARAVWHFNFLNVENIYFLVREDMKNYDFRPPDYLDSGITKIYEKMVPKLKFINIQDKEKDAVKAFDASKMIMNWKIEQFPSDFWKRRVRYKKGVWSVDKLLEREEAFYYLQAGFQNLENVDSEIERCRVRFVNLVKEIGQCDKVYIFGNGPSLSQYSEYDFSDGVSIICNSLIRDKEFMKHAKPKILVFGDPVFHFGPSLYASTFREDLIQALREYNLKVLVPLKYYFLLISNLPEIAENVIGIPTKVKNKINFNLKEEFYVESTSNIQTLLMLPMASTIADEIVMMGYDGRKISENSYFWKHNTETQYNEQMDNAKIAHPSFFKVDYNKYYLEHCETLEAWLSQGEKRGKSFNSRLPSYFPALSARLDICDLICKVIKRNKDYRIISINPDLKDSFGHYLHYDSKVRESVRDDHGDFICLSHQQADASLALENEWIIPTFKYNSWDAKNKALKDACRFDGQEKLEAVIGAINDEDSRSKNIFYMYLGDIRYIPMIFEAAVNKYNTNNIFVINVFGAHSDLFSDGKLSKKVDSELVSIMQTFREYSDVFDKLSMHICVDSHELQSAIFEKFNVELEIWPFFSTSMSENIIDKNIRKAEKLDGAAAVVPEKKPLCVYSPSNLRFEKGFDVVCDLISKIVSKNLHWSFKFVIREVYIPGTNLKLRGYIDKVRNVAKVVEGILSPDEYFNYLKEADVILIPYRKYEFYSRTSAVFSDSVILGKPVIVTKDTWAGRFVDKFGNGVTFGDGDIDGFCDALFKLRDNILVYKEKALDIRHRWVEENNTTVFINFLKRYNLNLKGDFSEYFPYCSEITRRFGMVSPSARAFQKSNLNVVKIDKRSQLDSAKQESVGKAELRIKASKHAKARTAETRRQERTMKSKLKYRLHHLYEKVTFYLVHKHPAEARIGMFFMWSLRTLKRRLFGIGGLAILLILGFIGSAYYSDNYRWSFVVGAGGMLLFLGAGLAVAYTRLIFYQLAESQRSEMRNYSDRTARDIFSKLQTLQEQVVQQAKELTNELKQNEARSEAEMQQVSQELNQEVKESAQQAGKELQVLRDQLENKAEELANGLKQNEIRSEAETEQLRKELNQAINESEQQAGKELQVLRDQLENKAEELANRLKQNETRSAAMVQGMRETLIEFVKKSEKLVNDQIIQLNKKEVETEKALEELHKESRQALAKSQKALAAHMDIISKANFLNAGIYQSFNRYLQNEHIQKILDFWRPSLALESLDRQALGYLAHRICQIENACSGRLATTLQDALLRVLVALSITGRKLEIMEIGSLFGISLAIIYDSCRGHFDRIHLTAIDPLEGYYDKSAYDIGTKVPINRTLFEHNMRITDIPKKDVTLIQALSTEKQAQETALKRSYNVLIIDGDHSYEGVKFDFEHYHHMVKRGGYIIFDDYNCKEWPDVTKFVDSEVKKKTGLKLVGNDSRTAVFRVH